ncbi:MAG: four helix bundle protein [Poseidonibacter sp.]|uniref:four helix bundle protein n=1 Tax=Poseidonibacter sp. TaxID=2321188 RepID=UPI00359DB530
MVNDFKDLLVWQKSIVLVEDVYKLVKLLPKEETYALSDQMRRSAVSIPSNIAEGFDRNSIKEYIHFLYISMASASELETQIIISNKIGYILEIKNILDELIQIKKMLRGLIKSLKSKIK